MNYGENDPLASLRENYRIEERPKEWHLFCLKCRRAYALAKSASGHDVRVGSILALLNQAASHEVDK